VQSHAGMNRALEAGLQAGKLAGAYCVVLSAGRLHPRGHGWVPLRFQVVLAFLARTPIRAAGQGQHATLPVRSASEACTPQPTTLRSSCRYDEPGAIPCQLLLTLAWLACDRRPAP
jgi:hypothetical protein